MLRRALGALLVAVLLSAWTAALLHPLTHKNESGQLVHRGTAGPADPLCDVLAGLSSCLAASAAEIGLAPQEAAPESPPTTEPRVAPPPPFLAQGPPVLL